MSSKLGAFLEAAYRGDFDYVCSVLEDDPHLAREDSSGPQADIFERDIAAIHLAAFIGHIEMMDLLIKMGADVNASGQAGTPLFQSVVEGRYDAVAWLLEHGADVKYVLGNGETALYIAAFKGDPEVVKALLQKGANPNVATTDGPTDTLPGGPPVMGESPLHLAAAYGHMDVIDMLLEAGADPQAVDKVGATPVHWAGRYLQTEARKKLRQL